MMMRTNLKITFEIPDYWTPEQALAVYELLQGLCERIMSHYQTQIIDEFREQHRPSKSQDCSGDPDQEF
jgi:hypothetical protein